MKYILLLLILIVGSCGFKAPPSPIFPTPKNQFDDEIKRRDKELGSERQEQAKHLIHSVDTTNATK